MGENYTRLVGKNVLIVEDEWLIADDLARALMEEGASIVGPAASVRQALSLLETSAVDAAVLDVRLDENSSVYLLAENLQRRGVPFMFATGFDHTNIRQDFKYVRHLLKPFEPSIVGGMLFETAFEPVCCWLGRLA